MTIISRMKEEDYAISQLCTRFMKRFGIKQLLRGVNATKEKGFPACELFSFLMGLIFSGKNLYTLLEICHEKTTFAKDTVYRFLNNRPVH